VVVAADPSLLPYNLPETFERWVVYYACSSAQFWALAGKELIPSLMQRPEAQLLIKAVQEMAQVEDGHPGNRHLVIQRLHSWSLEGGRLKLADCAAADAYLSDLDEDAIPPQEKVVEELAQTLRRQMLMQASNAIPGAFVAGPDAEKARKLAMDRLEAAGSVGKGDTSMGRSLDVGVLGEISALKRIPKIAVGIPEVDNILAGGVRYGENMFFLGDSSGGKCHSKGQLLLLADGTFRAVEDVQVGDRLMGWDGAVRTVLSLSRGTGQMFDIIPLRGKPWRVNADHVLTLRRRVHGKLSVVDVSVRDFLGWLPTQRAQAYLLKSGPVEFEGGFPDLQIPPYILGIYLGDGSSRSRSVNATLSNVETIEAWCAYGRSLGLRTPTKGDHGAAVCYSLSGTPGRVNPFCAALEAYGLRNLTGHDKFIPDAYKRGSLETRLAVLAGLIDTDGHLDPTKGTGYDYTTASLRLAEDVAFVARSVGLSADVHPCEKGCQTGAVGQYYRVFVGGDTTVVPCRVKKKKSVAAGGRKRGWGHVGFTIRPAGVEDYYGFTLDGDGRYLLDDFTVTHNSTALVHFACSALRQGCFVLYATLELARQYVMMRVVGNLTYTVLADIEYGRQPGYAEAGRRLDWLIAHHRIGRFVCKFHKKGKTALKDIRAWVGEEERRAGRKADLVVIDADEHVNHVDDDGSEYRGLGILYERMVDWAEGPDPDVDHDSKCVIATASQAKGRSGAGEKGDRILTHADTADSQRKHRNSYVCITINNRGERRSEVILNVSKNRNGDTGLTTTLPTNFAMGQLVVVNDAYPWIAQKKKWDAMRQMDLG